MGPDQTRCPARKDGSYSDRSGQIGDAPCQYREAYACSVRTAAGQTRDPAHAPGNGGETAGQYVGPVRQT